MTENYRPRLTNLSDFIRGIRWANGYSLEEVSENTGLHRNTISRIENRMGDHGCNIKSILILADFYNLHPSEFFIDN